MKDDTLLTHAGRDPRACQGAVNPPVYHVSTVLFPTLESFLDYPKHRFRYGRRGTPTSFALEEAVAELEHGYNAVSLCSGIAAISVALMSAVEAGDHILVADTVYEPTRAFCTTHLAGLGIETEYYDPKIGAGIGDLVRPNTKLVFVESPGSQTFEMQDVPAIADAAHAAGILVIADNTWSGGYFCKPMALGVDIVIQAGTKYVSGHSDVMIGLLVCTKETYPKVKQTASRYGICAGPDDVYLALRGLRTMGVRLDRHYASALKLAHWLADRPEVSRVMYPALETDPGHELWKRDFTGASGLFGFVLKGAGRSRLATMLDGMGLFGMGYSWGGFESLLIPTWPGSNRTATAWKTDGQTMRIHVGLEDPDDLIADLEAGFGRLARAG